MAKKIINVGDRPAVIRLVKKTGSSVSFQHGIVPQNAVNNTTELSFKLLNKPEHENRFVIGTFDTPNILNPNIYVTNSDAFSLDIDGTMLTVNAALPVTDPNYISRNVGVFLKFTATELQYVIGDRVGEASPRQLTVRLIDGGSMLPSTTVYTANSIVATRGAYFNDLNYYIPLYIGTLKHLEESWGAANTTLGMLQWYSTGSAQLNTTLNITHQVPINSVIITNAVTKLYVGDSAVITHTLSPANADVSTITYSTSNPAIASFADNTVPTLTVNAPGNFNVIVAVTDVLGNTVQTTKAFTADLNVQPMLMTFTVNGGEQISILPESSTAGRLAKIDWGDTTSTGYVDVTSTEQTHTFATAGTYQVKLITNGELDNLVVGKLTASLALRSVDDWGSVVSRGIIFRNNTNLTSIPATMPVGLTRLTEMFYGCTNFNQNISSWDVSAISDFSRMFYNASAFNQPIGSWVTSAATNLSGMFQGAAAFNQIISGWDVDSVTDFSNMFNGALAFNQNIGVWNTSSATTMASMFKQAPLFNQPIDIWDVSNVVDMSSMFQGTTNPSTFNQDISMWDVGNVTNMNQMFKGNIAFNQNLRYWCVSNIPSRPFEFTGSGTPIGTINEPRWGLCPIQNVAVTINGLDEPVRLNDVRTLTYTLTPDTPVQSTVWSSSNDSVAVINPETGNVIFTGLGNATISVYVNGLYTGTETITVVDVLQPMTVMTTGISGGMVEIIGSSEGSISIDWGDGSPIETVDDVAITHTFTDTTKRLIRLLPLDTDHMPNIGLGGEIEEVVNWYPGDMREIHLGRSSSKLLRVPSTKPNTTTLQNLFANCTLFNDDISMWNVSTITDMSGMFSGATAFNQPIGSWNVSNVNDMTDMFANASAFNQDISNWDVSDALVMDGMFNGATVFNRNLAWWCVTNIATLPANFNTGGVLPAEYYPTWGTCPSRVYTLTFDPVSDINIGDTAQLTYVLDPTITNVTVEWSSNNLSVAEVSNTGLVTGIGEGVARISVRVNHVFTGYVDVTIVQGVIVNAPAGYNTHLTVAPYNVTTSIEST